MIKGTTSNGFEYSVEEDILNDWEIVETLADMQDGKEIAVVKFVRMFLGEEQKNKLMQFCRDRDADGKPRPKAVMEEVWDILKSFKEGKNS